MNNMKYAVIHAALSIWLLTGCNMVTTTHYQKDRKVKDRDTYSNIEGMLQYQKDQNYLVGHELSDKCVEAKINLAIAKKNKHASGIIEQNNLIINTCI